MNVYDHDAVQLIIPRKTFDALLDTNYKWIVNEGHLRELHNAACQRDFESHVFYENVSKLPQAWERQQAWRRVVDGIMIAIAVLSGVALFSWLLTTGG